MVSEENYFLMPGGIFVSRDPMSIHTVLGSCISVCMWDRINGVGGMNHFIYHHATDIRNCRYGDVAIPHLVKLLHQSGGERKHFTAHIVGGAHSLMMNSTIGEENASIAKHILKQYNIPIDTVDIGGNCFRKIIFHNLSGEITIKKGEI